MEIGKVAMLMVVGMVMVAGLVDGQTNACESALVPCQAYLNSPNPPASCCTPLKQVAATQLQCLCGLLSNTALLNSFGINITQAQELPQHCGITVACGQSGSPLGSPIGSPLGSPIRSATPPPPPPPPGSGVGKLAWNGVSSLVVLLTSMVVIKDLFVF